MSTPVAPSDDGIPRGILEKARTLGARARRLKSDFEGAHRLSHQAQLREALTRSELTAALHESLAARALLSGRLREQALAAFRAGAAGRPLRRHNRPSRLIDRVLARFGAAGQALVIARAGIWDGAGGLGAILAYAGRRTDPAAAPAAPLDQAWYLAANPDVARGRLAPLAHYLLAGGREGRAPGPLFDAGWYGAVHAADLAACGVTPLEHYVRAGAARGFSPHPLFDPGHYLSQVGVLGPGLTPLEHYLHEGWRSGASPHVLFDPDWYHKAAGDIGEVAPLAHYLTEGWRRGLSPHPLFDVRWYLETYPDVAEAGVEPLAHYLREGGRQRRDPGPWFDTHAYQAARGDDLPPDANPLVDYLQGGAWQVDEARPGFPTSAYVAARADIARSGLTPLEHWARRGAR